ncbi:MAG TPA: hypothetical protein VNE39_24175 [Planctomycetota bacterium]|nr:hypothetical protein [Planctomycetota bacterium]
MEELGRRFSWASLPLVATIARLLCKEQTLQVEYLRKEVEVLRSKVPGRLRFFPLVFLLRAGIIRGVVRAVHQGTA